MARTDPAPNHLGTKEWNTLRHAHDNVQSTVAPAYDEVFFEVSERVRASGSIGKTDIGALLFWKRLRADTRWVKMLMVISDSQVRLITEKAVTAANNNALEVPAAAAEGRASLAGLPGFVRGDALASALLTAAAPHRMAVYDRRAQNGLEKLGLSLSQDPGRYGRYMKIVEDLSSSAVHFGHKLSAREIDLALYWLGRPASASA
ncbi:hypothetical protein AB0O52_10610 [Arthrobacter sp. NPDC080073]|uniref:hypothetical protein n=1 Tax=Arthrobacter sp. NPDC080073 TaxID=3155919 RepID=UPI003444E9F6